MSTLEIAESEDDGVRCDGEKYLADLLYLLERAGAVGFREVLMSCIWFAVGSFAGVGRKGW